MKHLNFMTHELKQRKVFSLGFVVVQNIGGTSQTLPCTLEAIIRKCCWFQIKRLSAQIHDMLIDEDTVGQVKFVRLFNMSVVAMDILLQENSYDTSCRQKGFHTISSQNKLQIFAVILVELAK